MLDNYDIVQALTRKSLPDGDRQRWIADFSYELGWRPSDVLALEDATEFSTTHLVVEHGLKNTAVISFLSTPFRELTASQRKVLFNASYNNLIDWHINIDFEAVSFVYNRFRPPTFPHERKWNLTRSDTSHLSSQSFEGLTDDHPSPDVLALDDAIIRTISLWKRHIGTELSDISNTQLSELFNAIIFLRAAEDHRRRKALSTGTPVDRRALLTDIALGLPPTQSIYQIIAASLNALNINPPNWLFDISGLRAFDALDPSSARDLFADFYRNRFERYFEYDFSLMSKHALSRIYEHYVSLLREPTTSQTSLFPVLKDEQLDRSYGNVYTPEFVARFFARFLEKMSPPAAFQRLEVQDPTCGSGIFLRTFVEAQQQTLRTGLRTTEALRGLFRRVHGLDIDANACHASRLSLALLALVLIDELPESLDINTVETLGHFLASPAVRDSMDVVIANPPFVRLEDISSDQLPRIYEVLGALVRGRVDLYLGILKIGIDMLKAAGFGLFVLPKNFLLSENAAGLRKFVSRETWVHHIVDLSSIQVFDDVSAYVILLVIQKKSDQANSPIPLFTQCSDLVGHALQDTLDRRASDSPFYSIYELDESALQGETWSIVPPAAAAIQRKFDNMKPLSAFAELRQGIITGADSIFIVDSQWVPPEEQNVFIPLLSDREMELFTIPSETRSHVFYPYVGSKLLGEADLKSHYPKTFRYLESHRAALQKRTAVSTKGVPWWRPSWPREPKNLLRPKIVTPHVVISPRFSLDEKGSFAVSRSPIILAKATQAAERDHLTYLLAILNSSACFWYTAQRSHSYRGGYSRLEMSTLKSIAIPDPAAVDRSEMRSLLKLVGRRIRTKTEEAFQLEEEIDNRVADLYGLTRDEREIVGIRK